MKKYSNGVVVGRFQPFHKGHLDYVLKALKETENLYIGITTPGKKPTQYEPVSPERFGKKNNPFTFKERKAMIAQSLLDEKIDLKRIKFVHYQPANTKSWFKKVPKNAVYFLLLLSQSEDVKVKAMQAQGLEVIVLETKSERSHQGFDIRQKILAGETWENLVPMAVEKILKKLDLLERLKIE
ncbi:adenylyltransferase/cytidyltransferase family protein [Candidatus Daviesbacteria bacterium]|nr:adenylyltransferase/cytidyltransferase family protein [Candidatus Daviesbacteria bacterium]